MTPFDNVGHGSHEDDYNYFHSSCWIYVECAVREIDSRWGIFWRPLHFSLDNNIGVQVILTALKLHNCILNFAHINGLRATNHDNDLYDDEECLKYLSFHNTASVGTFGDDTNDKSEHHPTNEQLELCLAGVTLRANICKRFTNEKMVHPSKNWYRNKFNHTQMA